MINLRVLVTGAGGFAGTHLMKKLSEENFEVMGVSRTSGFINQKAENHWRCDIQDKSRMKHIIEEFRPDRIYHLAAPAFIPDSYKVPRRTYDIIFNGTLNILECIKELELKSKFLFVSSADIYGNALPDNQILTEAIGFHPINPYSSAKACSELLCRQFYETYGTQIVIARPFNHTGPGQSEDFVCSNFAKQIAMMNKTKNRTLLTGNIDVSRDFLDVRDVVNAYYDILEKGTIGETYNVCSGKCISIRQVIEMLFESSEISSYYISEDLTKMRSKDISIRLGSNEKLRGATAWKPDYNIKDTLMELYHYWRERI